MSEKLKKPPRRGRRLLAAHTIIYLVLWATAIHAIAMLPVVGFSHDYTQFIAMVMLWLPFFLTHLAVYFWRRPPALTREQDREAYRQGFTDAVRLLPNIRQTDAAERLAIMDDESSESIEKPKRDFSSNGR